MLGAVVCVHAASIVHKRRTKPGFGIPLAGVTLTLVLIVLGVRALGRSVL
jgi:hypothetical protein